MKSARRTTVPAVRSLVPAAAIALSMALGGCFSSSSSATSKHREARVFHVDAGGIETLDVRSQKGRVDIAGHDAGLPSWATKALDATPDARDGEILIVAIVQSDEKKRIADATLKPEVDGGTLGLRADWPYSFSRDDGDGVEYAIRAPLILHAKVNTAFGDVDIVGARGTATIHTGFGDIRLIDQHGKVNADSGFGDIDIAFVGPHAERSVLDTGFGDIRARNVAGPIKADSGFGDISLTLTDDNAGPIDADSGFGDVRIEAGPAFAGRSNQSSGFGSARERYVRDTDKPKDSRVSTGFGDATVTIREGD